MERKWRWRQALSLRTHRGRRWRYLSEDTHTPLYPPLPPCLQITDAFQTLHAPALPPCASHFPTPAAWPAGN